MIEPNKEELNDVYFEDGCIDLTSCLYEYQGIQSRLLNWGEDYRDFNEEHFIESVKDFITKNPNKKMYVIDKYEAHNMSLHSGKTIKSLIKYTQWGELDITFAGGGYDRPGFPFRKISYWLGNNAYKNVEIKERKFDKHFLYMNRIRKVAREDLFYEMYRNNLLQDSYWSWCANDTTDPFHKTIENIVIDEDESWRENSILKQFKTSFLSIVPETFYNLNTHSMGTCFPTEKTEKCFVAGQPFIAYSTPFYLSGLKQLGFKTFSGFWDETYDNILDDNKRREAIISIVHQIREKPLEDLQEWYKEMIPILQHNQKINSEYKEKQNSGGFSFIDETIKDKIYPQLEKHQYDEETSGRDSKSQTFFDTRYNI